MKLLFQMALNQILGLMIITIIKVSQQACQFQVMASIYQKKGTRNTIWIINKKCKII